MDMGYAIGFSVEAEFGSMLEPAPAIITAGFGQSTENGEATGVFGDTCPFGEAYDGATMSVYDSNGTKLGDGILEYGNVPSFCYVGAYDLSPLMTLPPNAIQDGETYYLVITPP